MPCARDRIYSVAVSAQRRQLEHLEKLCERLGGRLKSISKAELEALEDDAACSMAPFARGLGIDHSRQVIYVCMSERKGLRAGEIIHEMAHVFACQINPANDVDDKIDEPTFLGWEIAAARFTGCTHSWLIHMKGYGIGIERDGQECTEYWRNLTAREKRRVIADRLVEAERLGLISESGEPLTIRSVSP